MSPQDALAEAGQPAHQHTGAVANDFSIQVATVNGSGSQTANMVLLRSIFQMGIPVSGKNLFPSNIAGLPTWFTIRANKHGYIGRKKEIDFLVAMNPETAREDVLSLEPGASCVYDEPLQLKALRTDITFFPVPFDKLVADVTTDAKLRRLVRNMIYDGILSFLLDIELDEMKKALDKQLGKKPKAMALNSAALDKGFAYAAATFAKAAGQGRADEQDGGEDAHRGQRRRRARLPVRRRHRRRLVSDHAVVVAVRDADRLPAQVPHRHGDRQGDLRRGPGRGRDRRARHGGRRVVGGRPLDDVDVRPGHLADGRVHRPRLLRRAAGGDLRHPARRPVDRACRPAPRSRTSPSPPACRTATAATSSCCRPPSPSATRWRRTPSTSPSACRRRSS